MKKLLKIAGLSLLTLVALVVALVLALPLWIGPVAKTGANAVVPRITGTGFNLGEFGLNQYSGRLHVGDVQLFNPEGFDQKMAFTLGALDVKVDVGSALGDTLVVNEVLVKDVFVSYVSHDGRNNFDIIMANVEKTLGPSKEKEEKEKSKQKVVIEKLSVSGVLVQVGMITLPVPSITLTDIGKSDDGKEDGVDWDTAASEIAEGVMKQLKAVGGGLLDLGGALKDLGVQGAGAALDAAGGAGKAAADAASSAASATADAVKDAASSAASATADAVKDGAGAAADAATDAIKDAGGALKGLLGK